MWLKCSIAASIAAVAVSSCASQQCISDCGPESSAVVLAYLERGMCEHALERAKLALEYNPDDAFLHNSMGTVLLTCTPNDPEPAIARFKRAIALNSDLAIAHNNLGAALLHRIPPEYGLACEEIGEALAIDPGYLDARENFGMCLARRAKFAVSDPAEQAELYAEARSQMMRLIEIDPLRADAWMWLGFVSLAQGRTDRATEELSRCVSIAPEHGACQLYLGDALLAAAECSPAIVAFSRAALVEAVAPDARRGLAAAQELCAKNDAAIRSRLDAIAKSPGDPGAHAELAQIYRDRGLHAEAEREWRNVIALEPAHCTAHFELAMIADQRLDTPETLASCREFVLCSRLAKADDDRVERCEERLVSLAGN